MTKRSLTTEMECNVRQMLKLIEDDGDSFAQKAEMYYKKRPELISLVEEFYRGYKSLVERFDHNTSLCDLQSQASGVSNCGSETPSSMPSPRLGRWAIALMPNNPTHCISTNHAAGFDVFLGSGGNVDACQKDGDGSSTLTESDEDFYDDSSSTNNFLGFFGNGNEHNSIKRRVMELEIEIPPEGKEKMRNILHEEEQGKNVEDFRAKISAYEQELRNVNEKLRLSEGEISKLNIKLETYRSKESTILKGGVEGAGMGEESLELKKLGEELRLTNEKLQSSEMQIVSLKFGATKTFETIQQLQGQLELAQKEIDSWKVKFNSQKRENSKLQERHARMRTSVADRENELRDLKARISEVEQKMFFERSNLKSEISKLLREQTLLEKKINEWECQCQSLQEKIKKIHFEKKEMGETLKGDMLLKIDVEDRKKHKKYVNVSLEALKLERDNLNAEVGSLRKVIHSRDNEIEDAHKQLEELTRRDKKLEEEIERQRVEILERAQEKREAIRQLCFSLDHYRNWYDILQQNFRGNKDSCFCHLICQDGCLPFM
ncbi:unnamed protein product [Sphenostylis stenocarpa]|uniref:NAB domain-containing protein n=1 Tax=Sphenostylis stenocarpa TaxID=92480 RepID=A0AA86SQ78_9FABA|nr:unnamed protein product [Sphenostylis stenocarpa]